MSYTNYLSGLFGGANGNSNGILTLSDGSYRVPGVGTTNDLATAESWVDMQDINALPTGTDTLNQGGNWMDSLGGYKGVQAGLGAAQFGLGLASYLDQKPLMKKQKELMNQQIEQNRFLIDQAKDRQKDISGAFGGGLAGSVVK